MPPADVPPPPARAPLTRPLPLLVAALVGVGWFVSFAGPAVLDPTHVGWLLCGEDWTAHLLGWLFFRNEPWTFPLGSIGAVPYPLGTTVGFTDSLPWVSLLLKPLSPLLPVDFQFIGPWLALCFALQGVAGAWLVRRAGGGRLAQVAAGAFFAFTPILLSRLGHEALCAHWLLVALVALNLLGSSGPAEARRRVGVALLLLVLAAGIHPYLAAMVLALAVALVVRLTLVERHLSLRAAALAVGGLVAAALGVFFLLGYVGGGATASAGGFGVFNADVLALVNPRGRSRLLGALPASRPHLEGYGYLGAGGLALLLFAVVSLALRHQEARRIGWARLWPVGGVALGFLVFSFANEVQLGGRTLLHLEALWRPLGALTGAFRTSGRFVWVAHYLLAVGAVLLTVRLWRGRPGVAAAALVLAAGLQAVDVQWQPGNLFRRSALEAGLRHPAWQQLGEEYRHLALVPAQMAWTGAPCEGEIPGHLRFPFAHLAYRQHLTFNSFYMARSDLSEVHAMCDALNRQVREGALEPDTVYVLGSRSAAAVRRSGTPVACGRLDGWHVCVSAARDTRLRALLAPSSATPLP